jgi:hypothetical protein
MLLNQVHERDFHRRVREVFDNVIERAEVNERKTVQPRDDIQTDIFSLNQQLAMYARTVG